MIKIIQINTTIQSEVDRFIELPYRLYANHPLWVPPLREITASFLNKAEHPFYERCDAEFLLAVRDGRDVARLALLEHQAYNHAHGLQEVWFYFFEFEDDNRLHEL